MISKPLRDLIPGDVVDDYGTHRTVESTTPGRDPNGYPTVSVTYTDGTVLVQAAGFTVEVVEG